jgi:hypothetical protein
MTCNFHDTEVIFAYFSCDSGGGDIQLPGPAVEVQYVQNAQELPDMANFYKYYLDDFYSFSLENPSICFPSSAWPLLQERNTNFF